MTIPEVGTPKQTMTLLLPSPLQEPSAHQKLIYTNSEERRGTTTDRNTTKLRKGCSVQIPPRAVPEELQPQSPLVKHIKVSRFLFEGGHSLETGMWNILQDAEEERFRIAQDCLCEL